jgi:hypothetical protein
LELKQREERDEDDYFGERNRLKKKKMLDSERKKRQKFDD